MRALIYARFSPRPNPEECDSIEYQVRLCRRWCEVNGHEVADVFADEEISGAAGEDDLEMQRPGLWGAFQKATRGDVIVVYKMDRIARSSLLAAMSERMMKAKGVRILSTRGEGTEADTPETMLMRRILAAFAEFERRQTGARTSAAMKNYQAAGRLMGRADRAPYGWRVDGEKLVPDDGEMEVVRMIGGAAEMGQGEGAILDMLRGGGKVRRDLSPWKLSQVRSVLARIKDGGYPTLVLDKEGVVAT